MDVVLCIAVVVIALYGHTVRRRMLEQRGREQSENEYKPVLDWERSKRRRLEEENIELKRENARLKKELEQFNASKHE